MREDDLGGETENERDQGGVYEQSSPQVEYRCKKGQQGNACGGEQKPPGGPQNHTTGRLAQSRLIKTHGQKCQNGGCGKYGSGWSQVGQIMVQRLRLGQKIQPR